MSSLDDLYFEFNTVPKFVRLSEVNAGYDQKADNFFKRASSGIQADFATNDAENKAPGPQGDEHIMKIEIVPDEEQMEKADEIPELDQTMNEAEEEKIISELATDLMKLSMFAGQPKKIRRSQIEHEERCKAKAMEQQTQQNRYDLRPRSASRSREIERLGITPSKSTKGSASRQRFTAAKTSPRPPTPSAGSVESRGRSLNFSSSSRSASTHTARAASVSSQRAPSAERSSQQVGLNPPRINNAVKRSSTNATAKVSATDFKQTPTNVSTVAPMASLPLRVPSKPIVPQRVPAKPAGPTRIAPGEKTGSTRQSAPPAVAPTVQPRATPVTRAPAISRLLGSNKPTTIGELRPASTGTPTPTPKRAFGSTGPSRSQTQPSNWVDRLYQPRLTPAAIVARESRLAQKQINSARPVVASRAVGARPGPIRVAAKEKDVPKAAGNTHSANTDQQ